MKKINLLLLTLLSTPFALAGGMYDSNTIYGGGYLGLTGFILGSFAFSLIFWLVYIWIVKNNGELSRKKK